VGHGTGGYSEGAGYSGVLSGRVWWLQFWTETYAKASQSNDAEKVTVTQRGDAAAIYMRRGAYIQATGRLYIGDGAPTYRLAAVSRCGVGTEQILSTVCGGTGDHIEGCTGT
jgi:hypothetical protein